MTVIVKKEIQTREKSEVKMYKGNNINRYDKKTKYIEGNPRYT
jgi:hypothetical protein